MLVAWATFWDEASWPYVAATSKLPIYRTMSTSWDVHDAASNNGGMADMRGR